MQEVMSSNGLAAGSVRLQGMEGSLEFDVDVADHVVSQIVADVEMLDLSKLVHLLKDVLIEVLVCHRPRSLVPVLS